MCSVFWVNSAQIARYFFGVAEFMLTLVGVVDAIAGGHFGSWTIFLFLSIFLFARWRKGCKSYRGLIMPFSHPEVHM